MTIVNTFYIQTRMVPKADIRKLAGLIKKANYILVPPGRTDLKALNAPVEGEARVMAIRNRQASRFYGVLDLFRDCPSLEEDEVSFIHRVMFHYFRQQV